MNMSKTDGVICANRPDAERDVVDQVLGDAHEVLDTRAQAQPSDFVVDGLGFERIALDALTQAAKGTMLDGKIELISGHRFPDVLARLNNGCYGIEVKSTSQDHWTTTGNSVLESTRIENVKRVYILFGKLCHPIAFKIRPYEDCLSEVTVTHSPRYQIDMDLPKGETIFDKIGKSYDQVREAENPAMPFVEYYRKNLRPGESLWWTGVPNDLDAAPMRMSLWNNLSPGEKEKYRIKALVYFPELWSNAQDKYSNFLLWLVRRYGIVCGNIRDSFSAGGQVGYEVAGKPITGLRHIVKSLIDRRGEFLETLREMSVVEMETYWGECSCGYDDRLSLWLKVVGDNLSDDEFSVLRRALSNPGQVREISRGRWGR